MALTTELEVDKADLVDELVSPLAEVQQMVDN